MENQLRETEAEAWRSQKLIFLSNKLCRHAIFSELGACIMRQNRESITYFLHVILSAAVSSCAPATEPGPRIGNTGGLESRPPHCEINISIDGDDKVSFGQLIGVRGKVRVEGGGKTPESITVSIKEKEKTVTSYAVTLPPEQSSFEFKVDLKRPPQKGQFVVQAEGVIREGTSGHEAIRRVMSNQIRVNSLGKQK